jgi:hypothetical protein
MAVRADKAPPSIPRLLLSSVARLHITVLRKSDPDRRLGCFRQAIVFLECCYRGESVSGLCENQGGNTPAFSSQPAYNSS